MRELHYFVAIAFAIVAGFGIGFSAGVSEPITKDVEWETLLAGAMAIAGGGLAYIGATQPFRRELQRKIDNHVHELRSRCDGFLIFTEPGTEIFELFSRHFDPEGLGGDNDMITTLARSAFANLPDIPEDIVTPELRLGRGKVSRQLACFGRDNQGGPNRAVPDIQGTRQAILDYCKIASREI